MTCHSGRWTGAARAPSAVAPRRIGGRGRGSRAVVSLRGSVGLSLLAEKLPFPRSLEDFDGCLPFGVKEGKDPSPI